MADYYLGFLNASAIDVAVDLPCGQNGQPINQYIVTLAQDNRKETFAILGSPEAEGGLSPEDAVRALYIRAQMFETKAALSSAHELLCKETAVRLKYLLGSQTYLDFLNLDTSRQERKKKLSWFARVLRPGLQECSAVREDYVSLQ